MKDGQVEEHEKEVYGALFKYFSKILSESGYIGTVMEMGNMESDGEAKKWAFDWNNNSGAFVFEFEDIEVYATPYWEFAEGIAYAVYQDVGPFLHNLEHVVGVIPIVVTGNSQVDVEAYVGLIDDLMEKYNL